MKNMRKLSGALLALLLVLLLALGGIVVLAALVIGVTKLAQAIGEYVELNTDHTVHLPARTTGA